MSERNVRARFSGTLQDAQDAQARHDGELKSARSIYVRDNGELVQVWPRPTDIPDSVVYHSKFDEGSGSTTDDEVTGTEGDINGATWVTGSNEGDGDAHLDFGGDDDVNTNVVPVTGSQNRTFAAWINPDALDSDSAIIGWGNDADGEKWVVQLLSGDLRVEIYNGAFTSSLTPATDSWQFVACILDGDQAGDHTLYLDGSTESGDGSGQSVNTQSNVDARIGYDAVQSRNRFEGGIDAPWVADRAWSISELDDWRDDTKGNYGL